MRCEKISIQKGSSGKEMKEKDRTNDEGRERRMSERKQERKIEFCCYF